MSDTRQTEIIRLGDPLPCGVVHPGTAAGYCGRPAWVAYVWRMEAPEALAMWAHLGGLWTLQPVCSQCAQAAARVCGVDKGQP